MILTDSLSKNGEVYLSKHFQLKEFASTSGSKVYSDTVKYNPELINKLEQLFSLMQCSKIVVNSGYRTPAHDRAVGGSGSGEHVNGNAADIKVYDKNGKVVSSKIVCCIAADMGFGGVAAIRGYTSTHVDVRSTKYWGDENINYRSIWYQKAHNYAKDFYTAFNLTKQEVDKYRQGSISSDTNTKEPVKTPDKTVTLKSGKWYVREKAGTMYDALDVAVGGKTYTYSKTTLVGATVWYYLDKYKGWVSGNGVSKVTK